MKRLLPIFAFLMISGWSYGQIVIDDTQTPNDLVFGTLLGEGVTASNIVFTGYPDQIGFFNGVNSNIGLDSGIVLSAGPVSEMVNIAAASYAGNSYNPPGAGDPDLLTIAQSVTTNPSAGSITATNDAAILEFDFIPNGDTVRFNFVFASDEYNTWINSSFNDVFAFLISGPGITGPYASPPAFPDGAENFALVPGTDLPITISTIYDEPSETPPQMNAEYYISNVGGTTHIFNAFTTVIEIEAPVICGELFHFKFGVADCQDTFLASSVFLEAQSFSAEPEEIKLSTVFEPGIIELAGICDSSFASFNRNCAADSGFYQLKFQGEPIEGVDFITWNLPDTIILAPGETEHTFGISAIPDGIDEGVETMEVILCVSLDPENEPFLPQDTAYLDIFDEFNLPITSEDINLICPTPQVVLTAEALNGTEPYIYSWLDGSGTEVGNTPVISVDVPDDEEVYTIQAEDLCGLTGDLEVTVTNSIPPDPVVNITEDEDPFCPGAPYDLTAVIEGGTPGFSYLWSSTEETESITVTAPTGSLNPYPVQVFITDFCNRAASTTIELIPPPLIDANGIVNDLLCLGDDLPLSSLVEGGVEPYQYTWLLDNVALDQSFYSIGTGEGEVPGMPLGEEYIYTLLVTDYCWNFDPMTYIGFDTDTLDVIACFVPNVFSPNGDNLNDEFLALELETKSGTMHIFNRWGVEIYTTSTSSWDGEDAPEGTYFYVIEFADGTDPVNGSVTLLR